MTTAAFRLRTKRENSANELCKFGALVVRPKYWIKFSLLLIGLAISQFVGILRLIITPLNSSKQVYIKINPHSILSRDVASIEHNANDATITVCFRAGATCPRPFLLGRLSGPALSLIQDWRWQRNAMETTSLTGSYHVPFAGNYHIEIIALYCSDFTLVDEMDFTHTCVVNPFWNRLSIHSAAISVSRIGSAQGYWIANQTTIHKNPIMYTRFQPEGCRLTPNPEKWIPVQWPTIHQESICGIPTSLERFMNYHFEYSPSSSMNQLSLADLTQENLMTICVIGASHGREIASAMRSMGISREQVRVEVKYAEARYPTDISLDRIKQLIDTAGCDILVIAVGQWPASFDGGRPTLINDYHDQIKVMLMDLVAGLTLSHPYVKIFMRSIHYNPLNEMISACPPQDWRSPAVIDAYNRAISKVCKQMEHVKFVDTNFIVGPMWDSSPDWCHFSPELQSVEAFYLAAVALGVVEHSQSTSK